MVRKALSPETKAQRKQDRRIKKAATEAERERYKDEIHTLASQLAVSKPAAPATTIHDWRVELCLGKSGTFSNIGRWFAKASINTYNIEASTNWVAHSLIQCNAKHSEAKRCFEFRWLSPKLRDADLDKLKRLWVRHDVLTKKAYNSDEKPSEDVIQKAFSNSSAIDSVSNQLPTPANSSPVRQQIVKRMAAESPAANSSLLTPPSTTIRQHLSQSQVAGPSKRAWSPSPSPVPHKKVKIHGADSGQNSRGLRLYYHNPDFIEIFDSDEEFLI